MKRRPTDEAVYRLDEKLPEKRVRVIVICRGCRCLGYLDDDGKWKRHYGNDELTDVVAWMP